MLTGQIGHDEYHFDNNAFAKGDDYIAKQRESLHLALENREAYAAWASFGRLTHATQDFYAHTNYVDLWLAQFGENPPSPADVEPVVENIINSPDLHSGKLYYPLEVFYFVSFLKRFVLPLLPKDSHAHMNLDSPKRGQRFAYAFEAAVKRTRIEYETVIAALPEKPLNTFLDATNKTTIAEG